MTSATVAPSTPRAATRADIPAMHAVRLAVRENVLRSADVTEAAYVDAIEGTGRGWVVEADGRIVGFAVGNRLTGNLWALFVDPAHEGRGIGRALLADVLDWWQAQDVVRAWLSSEPGTRAQRFYERAGWFRVGTRAGGEAAYEWVAPSANPVARLSIRVDDLRGPAIAALLNEHLADMRRTSPPGSVHALDLEGLRRPSITFRCAWDGDTLAGCGALRALDADHGEVKSMRTSHAYRGRGVAAAILAHLLDTAARRGMRRVSLETGSMPFFAPAHRLYERFGFARCAPFGDCVDDPNSVFMTRTLP